MKVTFKNKVCLIILGLSCSYTWIESASSNELGYTRAEEQSFWYNAEPHATTVSHQIEKRSPIKILSFIGKIMSSTGKIWSASGPVMKKGGKVWIKNGKINPLFPIGGG